METFFFCLNVRFFFAT